MHFSFEPINDCANPIAPAHFAKFSINLKAALPPSSPIFAQSLPINDALVQLLSLEPVYRFLIDISKADVFASDVAVRFSKSDHDLSLLRSFKLLKFCYSLPCGQLCNTIATIVHQFDNDYAPLLFRFAARVLNDDHYRSLFMKRITISERSPPSIKNLYQRNADFLLHADPHAIYPTSIYRHCAGHVTSTSDSRTIEAVMGTTITTTIQICRNVLNPSSQLLSDIYKPLGRCIAVVDQRLDALYGHAMDQYFAAHSITFQKLVYRCMEVDKDISTVEKILVDLKACRVSRNEPVLVVGGGVIADVGGFACALYHRNTPYVMLCTSIVSGIDAGPSPRTCCDGLGYKNVFGAYHPPILTITDRHFFKTLQPGWIRHGIAEIIKIAVTKDSSLFQCLELAGDRLVTTKFGIDKCQPGSDIDTLAETIIAKALEAYVRSEYGNLWETHQCRPHAYGHTWSPGFELQAGLLHGHAVAIGMGYGAYLSFLENWITEQDFHRILKLMSVVGLSLRHDILDNSDSLWASQVKMTEKRGGNLCAPLPRGKIGACGYLNDLTRERLEETLLQYQEIVKAYPREGYGVEPHCKDVGLEDPSTVKQHADNAVIKGSLSNGCDGRELVAESAMKEPSKKVEVNGGTVSYVDAYNKWIDDLHVRRSRGVTSSSISAKIPTVPSKDTLHPPVFDHTTLFHDGAENYAYDMTSFPTKDYATIADETNKANLFAPCMVGAIEGQFLKMLAQIKKAGRVLDIGTFTGYSALAFADGIGPEGEVVTLEADATAAAVARSCFSRAKNGGKIKLIETDARAAVTDMAAKGERFDIVFLDADKTNYRHYYEAGLEMLTENGVLMADNALCSLVYDSDDPVRQSLHEFAQFVRSDPRVEQVMLTVREGILLVQKV